MDSQLRQAIREFVESYPAPERSLLTVPASRPVPPSASSVPRGLVSIVAVLSVLLVVGGIILHRLAPTHSGRAPAGRARPTANASLLIYQTGPHTLAGISLAGGHVRSISVANANGVVTSLDGDRLLVWPRVIDSRGRVVGKVDLGASVERDASWSVDGSDLCILSTAPSQGPDAGSLTLWLWTPGHLARALGHVGRTGSIPSISACAPNAGRIVLVNVMRARAPNGAAVLSADSVDVFDISSHQVTKSFHVTAQATVNGIGVASSRDGRDLALPDSSGTKILDVTTGQVVGTVSGVRVIAFSADANSSLIAAADVSNHPEVVRWRSDQVVWQSSAAIVQHGWAVPGMEEVLLGLVNANGGLTDVIVVNGTGDVRYVVRNQMPVVPCPCPGADAS